MRFYISMNDNKYFRNFITVSLFGVVGILKLPLLLLSPTTGLDPSWRIGLNMASMNNFQFGKDIVFTFGPLGFLYLPTYTDFKLWAISSSFTLIIHFIFLASIALLAIKSSLTWKQNIFVFITLLSALPLTYIEYKLLISVAVLLYLVITGKINHKYIVYTLLISSILLAIVSQIKFSATPISLSIIIILALHFLHKRQFKWLFYVLFSYVIVFLSLWVISGQELANLPAYFSASIRISKGYNSAMMITGKNPLHIIIGILVIASTILLWLTAAIKRNYNLLLFISIFSGIVFISFKHGFVRQDGHVYIFFANMLIFLCLLYISNNREIGSIHRSLILFLSLIIFLAIHTEYPHIMKPDIKRAIRTLYLPSFLLSGPEEHKEKTAGYKDSIRKSLPLSEKSIDYLQNKSVDIFPWEISLAYAYDLIWRPRPVFQSYSAYTSKLDLLNARHFEENNIPERIIYSNMSIDGRYPVFDEPATFQRLLCRYAFHHKDGEFIILGRTPDNRCGEPVLIASLTANIGEPIKVSDYNQGYIFAKITMEYSWLGKIATLFYKPSTTYINIINADGLISNKFRFIQNNASNGLFVSQNIYSTTDLISVFSGELDLSSKIKEIIISADTTAQFKKKVKVKYIALQTDIEAIYSAPDWQKMKRVNGGHMSIDSVNGILYARLKDNLVIDVSQDKSFTLNGWAIDNNSKKPGDKVYLVLSNNDTEITLRTSRVPRPDVAQYFGENTYLYSGWTSSINPDNFKEMCYSIAVHILRDNREEYYMLDGNRQLCFKKE